MPPRRLIDIHCHMLPEFDDGATSWDESLAMACMAYDDGVETVVVTPHQLGMYAHNLAADIRTTASSLQERLHEHHVALQILPGAEVRLEPELMERLRERRLVTLGDHGKHLLLELPPDVYVPLDHCLDELHAANLDVILAHPERNLGLLRSSQLVESLVQRGCLMQVTAGSLLGAFGAESRTMAEQMIQTGRAHFLATDAHGSRSRRPLLKRAYERVAALAGEEMAQTLCCHNPACVARGEPLPKSRPPRPNKRSAWFGWRAGKHE